MPSQIEKLRLLVEKHWGFRDFRPLQEAAMEAELADRDSLVVLPTGGGKSLCFQAPALLRKGATVVVSPLIALMKDQVDGLQACGVHAGQIDSTMSSYERSMYEQSLIDGTLKLLFVSPERLVMPEFIAFLKRNGVKHFAIDEAHCISHWGHDFRPEYRQLGQIKEWFPGACVHGYTATATEQVRKDICRQLNQTNPLVLVGNFDRPNLTYRVQPRVDLHKETLAVVERHRGEAGIIYCLRRADVEDLNNFLVESGYKSLPYHAGLDRDERRRIQEEFAEERCDLIVATIAFGMGIDRSNLRFVLHANMPKSIEHYQQETGRAGRDGLEAECVLLHSAGDRMTWERILKKSAQENEVDADFLPNALKHVDDMDRYARGASCRHAALVRYFGQNLEGDNCNACDLCLGDKEIVADGVVVAQKILSCVARVQERFGLNHVMAVLRGEMTDKIQSYKHDQLSTFGLLKEHSKVALREWIYQLVGQGVLEQTRDEYPILKLNPASWEVMKKQRQVRLMQPVQKAKAERPKKSKSDTVSWEGVDRDLFENLRLLRLEFARTKQVPPYVIFSDAVLRDLAKVKPKTLDAMRPIKGIGDNKLRDFGPAFLQILTGQRTLTVADIPDAPAADRTPAKRQAFDLFEQGASIEEVIKTTARARSTVLTYLAEYIRDTELENIDSWVPRPVYDQVAATMQSMKGQRLTPIFEALGGKVPYETLRLVAAHLGEPTGPSQGPEGNR